MTDKQQRIKTKRGYIHECDKKVMLIEGSFYLLPGRTEVEGRISLAFLDFGLALWLSCKMDGQ